MFNKIKKIGPGAMVAAAFIGPGTVTTATLAGSSYGYTLLWAILFSIIATYILQEMAARLGLVGQMGIGQAVAIKITHPLLKKTAAILIIGAILIGNAAYEAGNLTGAVLGFGNHWHSWAFSPLILIIGSLAAIILWLGNYHLIERFLIALVAWMGITFLVAAMASHPNWTAVLSGLFQPSLPQQSLLMVIGLIGTTVVPYNLFLHAAAVQKRWSKEEELPLARWDLMLSTTVGGLITMSILIAAAAVQTDPSTTSQLDNLSLGLVPLLGDWAGLFLALGFLAAGLSSAITAPLAAAFATSEVLGWDSKLSSQHFRIIWALVLGIGLFCSCLGFKPTLVILFAQIANGLLLPIVAFFLLWVMNDSTIMGKKVNTFLANSLGLFILLITILLGTKGILAALGYF